MPNSNHVPAGSPKGGQFASTKGTGGVDKAAQFYIIQKLNPAQDDYHTWIRSVDDIRTLGECLQELRDDGYEESEYPDVKLSDLEAAAKGDKPLTVYSSKPITNGNWVTPSKMEATAYAGSGKVHSAKVAASDVAWVDSGQGMFAQVKKTGKKNLFLTPVQRKTLARLFDTAQAVVECEVKIRPGACAWG